MEQQRGSVLHCSRFGCIIRLDDGRLAFMPAGESGMDMVRRAAGGGRHPQFPFNVVEEEGRRVRVRLASESRPADQPRPSQPTSGKLSSSLEQKIIDFWRQTAEWDRNAGSVEVEEPALQRADRLLPFAVRTRRQYRESPKRGRRPKR